MCGIAGFVGGFVPRLASRMNAAQAHRGPDGRGIFEDAEAGVALGHVRLSILDLSPAAAQPMHSAEGRFVIVFNGEIYNYRELRQELEQRGRVFASSGDTAVLLAGLAEHGLDFLPRLNGMFAFALWDRRERALLLARDQLGVKPLYLAEPVPGALLFASEIKALCAHPRLNREPDFVALQEHLAYCHASGERTALKGVRRLGPGRWLRWRADRIEEGRFWRPPCAPERHGDLADETARLAGLTRQAAMRQLVSDVPVGSFLSGGLDSSLLTAHAAATPGFSCFTITYGDADNILDRAAQDAPHARTLARTLGLPLHEIELRPDVADLWPRLVRHLDEPIADPAALACFLICRQARQQGVPVLLSGQGADELFCGYPRYQVMRRLALLGRAPAPLRQAAAAMAGLLPGSREGRLGALARRVRRALANLDLPEERRFLALCANTPQTEISRVLSPAVRAELAGTLFDADCLRHMATEGLSGIKRLQERDLSVYLPNHNLLYTDKMGMAVGVEARVPLLDLELADRAAAYPAAWLLAGGEDKVILRAAARGVVPDSIIDRPKAGFGAPYRKWLRYDLGEMWDDLTAEAAVKRRGWFDAAALADARKRSQNGSTDLYMLQWATLTTEIWARAFIDDNPAQALDNSHNDSQDDSQTEELRAASHPEYS